MVYETSNEEGGVEVQLSKRYESLITTKKKKNKSDKENVNRINIGGIEELKFSKGKLKIGRKETLTKTKEEMSEDEFCDLMFQTGSQISIDMREQFREIVSVIDYTTNKEKNVKKGVIIKESANEIIIETSEKEIEEIIEKRLEDTNSWFFYSLPDTILEKNTMKTLFMRMLEGPDDQIIYILGNGGATNTPKFQIGRLQFRVPFAWNPGGMERVEKLSRKCNAIWGEYKNGERTTMINSKRAVIVLKMIESVNKELKNKNMFNDDTGKRLKYLLSNLQKECYNFLREKSGVALKRIPQDKNTDVKLIEFIVGVVLKELKAEKNELLCVYFDAKKGKTIDEELGTNIEEKKIKQGIKKELNEEIKNNRKTVNSPKGRIQFENPNVRIDMTEGDILIVVEDVLQEKRRKLNKIINETFDNSSAVYEKMQNDLKLMTKNDSPFLEKHFKSFCLIIKHMIGLIDLEIDKHQIKKKMDKHIESLEENELNLLEVDVLQPYMKVFFEEKYGEDHVIQEPQISGGKLDFLVHGVPVELKVYSGKKTKFNTVSLLKKLKKQITRYSYKTHIGILIGYDYRSGKMIKNRDDPSDDPRIRMIGFELAQEQSVLLCFIGIPGNRKIPSDKS